ncbi:OsmC family protein (plasmid) [Priestia megaterium]|uniref:OsmC family protein n=1 Tax=Priestia megaterium TaxID=1404 RepID=UPI002ACD52F1|nr:OsmC family protein [Priestia megaterium]
MESKDIGDIDTLADIAEASGLNRDEALKMLNDKKLYVQNVRDDQYEAKRYGIKVNSLEVNASGQLDLNVMLGLKEGNPGFNEVDVQFTVDIDADDKQVEELVSKAMEISPVKNSLERNVQVNSTFKRNK